LEEHLDGKYELYRYTLDSQPVVHYWFYGWPDFGVPDSKLNEAVRGLAHALAEAVKAKAKVR